MKNGKTRSFIGITLGMVMCLGLFAGCSSSNSQPAASGGASSDTSTAAATSSGSNEKMTLRFSDSQAVGYITITMDQKMADEISQKTNGRIQMKIYPGGQLGSEKAVLEQMQYGAVDGCRVSSSGAADFNKDIGVVSLPYVWTSDAQMFRALDGQVGQELDKSLLDNSKFVNLAWTDAGARSFYTAKKQVKTPADLKGLKIRVQQSQVMIDLVKCFGASPTPLDQNDIYSALQSGVVDGAENNFSSFVSMNHDQVCKYFTIDEHSRVPEMILFSSTTWNKIDPADQQIIRTAATNAALWERKQWVVDEDAAEQKAKQAGTVITTISDLAPWRAAVKPLYDQHPEWANLVKEIQSVK